MENTIRQKVEQLDLPTGSVYDFNAHLPFPTLDSIYANTGINLVELEGSTMQAEAKVKMFTRKAFKILTYNRVEKTNRDLEFLIATTTKFRQAFLEYVINLIGDLFISGNNSILTSSTNETSESLRQRARLYYAGTLDAPRYQLAHYEYRLGY